MEPCIQCGSALERHLAPWCFRCPACGLLASTLHERAAGTVAPPTWDEESERVFEPLRRGNAERILASLSRCTALERKHVLDVGCAAGWFLDACVARGMSAVGIEVDRSAAERARARGHDVRSAPFPSAEYGRGAFDVVAFNDVFEHLREPVAVLACVREVLAPDGFLVLSLPNSRGALYRAASALARLGVAGPFERLWQCEFESPHLFYFHAANLRALVEAHGFRLQAQGRLPAYTVSGLADRIDESAAPLLLRRLAWCALVGAYPAVGLLPADTIFHVYRRSDAPVAGVRARPEPL